MTTFKGILAKVATVGLLAGAVAMAAPQKAEAQVRFGVRIGGPVYVGPRYVAPPVYGYYGPQYYGHPYYGYYHHPYGYYGRGYYGHEGYRRGW